jgi:hypothetical protein
LEPLTVVEPAIVEAECLLVYVAVKVERLNTDVRSLETSLEK